MGSLTPNAGFTLPTIGGDTGPLFAQEINGDFSIADGLSGGTNTLSVAGNANVTLNTSQSQNLIQQFTGALTGNITVFLPAVGRSYAVENATSGPFSLFVGCTGGGNTQIIPQGLSTWLWTDGTFTRLSSPPGWQEIGTYSISGAANSIVTLPPPFRRFRLTLQTISFGTTGAGLFLQFSSNGGSSFFTTGYNYVLPFSSTNGTSGISQSSSAGSMLVTTTGIAPDGGNTTDATLEIFPGNPVQAPRVRGSSYGIDSASQYIVGTIGGGWFGSGQVMNAVNLAPGAGTFSGTVIVEGFP